MLLNKIVVSLLVLFFVVSGEMISQPLSGTKTIGGEYSPDYSTIKDAVEALTEHGITGSVKFEINNGTYNDKFIIDSIPGVSLTDTIVFTSKSEEPTEVTISRELLDSDDFLVRLNNCERVTFKNITFKTISNQYSNQVRLEGGASNNRFENCIFEVDDSFTCTLEKNGIVIHNVPSDSFKEQFNQFINNQIIGGCIGISLEGVTARLEKGNQIIGNNFTKQITKAVEILHNNYGKFNDNTVKYGGDYTAVTLNVDKVYEVQGNNIYSGGAKALFIDSFLAEQPKIFGFKGLSVFNNAISCPNGVALEGNEINGFFFGHNTLFNNTTQYTIQIDSVINMVSVFNLLVNKANYGILDITTGADSNETDTYKKQFGSDFNGVYSGNGSIGLLNGKGHESIDDWQANLYFPGSHSSFGDIMFNDTLGLELICGTSPSMRIKKAKLDSDGKLLIDLLSNPLVNLFKTKDVNGNDRDTSNFWKGQADIDVIVNVNGYITNLTDTLERGVVKIFAKRTNKNILEEIESVSIEERGYYTIDSLPYRDNYWLKIIPEDSGYVPSYHTKELRWDSGDEGPRPLADFCDKTIIYNIFPKKLDEIPTGNYSISGNITQMSSGFSKMLGTDPIPGLDVILDAIPPSRTVAVTQTDSLGNYKFSNLPPSDFFNPNGTYIIIIDYQGLPKDTLYEIELKGDRDSIINLNYCVDTAEQIEGCAVPLVTTENFQFKGIRLYPNPMGETLTISGLGEKFDVHIFDARGRHIMNLANQSENALIPTVNFKSGLYFVVIKTSQGDSLHKIVK